MKRIIRVFSILVVVCLCSACTINYNLEITENEIVENINVNDTYINGRSSNDIVSDYNTWMPVYSDVDDSNLVMDQNEYSGKLDGVEYHEKAITKMSNGYYLTYKYTYPIDRYGYANSLKLAFGNPSVYDAGNYINIRTDNRNALCNYSYFESLKVNIKVDLDIYKVTQSNADNISGNIYTWNLNRNNCDDSVISLTLNRINNTYVSTTTNKTDNNKKQGSKLDNYVIYIFIGVVVLIVSIGYIWFNKMKNRGNKMDD